MILFPDLERNGPQDKYCGKKVRTIKIRLAVKKNENGNMQLTEEGLGDIISKIYTASLSAEKMNYRNLNINNLEDWVANIKNLYEIIFDTLQKIKQKRNT